MHGESTARLLAYIMAQKLVLENIRQTGNPVEPAQNDSSTENRLSGYTDFQQRMFRTSCFIGR